MSDELGSVVAWDACWILSSTSTFVTWGSVMDGLMHGGRLCDDVMGGMSCWLKMGC